MRHADKLVIAIMCLTSLVGSAHAAGLESLAGNSKTAASIAEGSAISDYPQPVDKSVTLWKRHAKQLVAITWSPSEWQAFNKIIYRESRWRPNQLNKQTNAYGLGQIINSKRYTAQMPFKQINAAIKYIYHRYGTPTKALAHHYKHGWY